jgi:hypothetical protein
VLPGPLSNGRFYDPSDPDPTPPQRRRAKRPTL